MTESFFKDEGRQEKPTEIPDLNETTGESAKSEQAENFSKRTVICASG